MVYIHNNDLQKGGLPPLAAAAAVLTRSLLTGIVNTINLAFAFQCVGLPGGHLGVTTDCE